MKLSKFVILAVYCLVSQELIDGNHLAECLANTMRQCQSAKVKAKTIEETKDYNFDCLTVDQLPGNTIIDPFN